MMGHVWPDGGSLLDQPNVLIEAWAKMTLFMEKAKKGEPL